MKVAEAVAQADKVRRNARRIKSWQAKAAAIANDVQAGTAARALAMAAEPMLSQLLLRNRHALFFLAHCPKARKAMASFLKGRDREQIEGSVADDRAYKELCFKDNTNRLVAESNVIAGVHMARQVDQEFAELRQKVTKAKRLAKGA